MPETLLCQEQAHANSNKRQKCYTYQLFHLWREERTKTLFQSLEKLIITSTHALECLYFHFHRHCTLKKPSQLERKDTVIFLFVLYSFYTGFLTLSGVRSPRGVPSVLLAILNPKQAGCTHESTEGVTQT